MSSSLEVPREAAELIELAEREPIEDALIPLDPERLSEVRVGGGLAWGVIGHGVMSWRFRLVARLGRLDLDFIRPAPGVLSDESVRERKAENIRTVCRLAALAVCRAKAGQVGRLTVRSESAESWTWSLERDGAYRFGDTFCELVEILAEDGEAIDPLMVERV